MHKAASPNLTGAINYDLLHGFSYNRRMCWQLGNVCPIKWNYQLK